MKQQKGNYDSNKAYIETKKLVPFYIVHSSIIHFG